jgi:acetate kinase
VNILTVNAGSSSIKVRVLDDRDTPILDRSLPHLEPGQVAHELERVLADAPVLDAAGHRVVHGGSLFTRPLLIDDRADETLSTLADLAPLHNPPALAAIHALLAIRPHMPQVACFDTAFHTGMPPRAFTYALPKVWRDRWGLRRYGFHGLSHAWSSRRAAELLDRPLSDLRLVTAHLGAGASLAAVDGGRSVDTTMGFTPLEGLVMARRSGSVDPGLLLWVQRHAGLSAAATEDVLEHQSGLYGLSGTDDLREVIASADAGDDAAALGYDVFVYRVRTSIGAMAAALGGMDGLVFTGGAGQASERLRSDVTDGLTFLGVAIDGSIELGPSDAIVSPPGSSVAVAVVECREDIEIARHVRALLA